MSEVLVDIVAGGGLPEVSIQEVADRAGVSHRTVYRYFSTREALLEALTERVEGRMAARGGVIFPETVDDLPEVVRRTSPCSTTMPERWRRSCDSVSAARD